MRVLLTNMDLKLNQVLAILPDDTLQRIADAAVCEKLAQWQMLRDENELISRVYFPIDGVISIVTLTEEGDVAESYTAGRDGAAGAEIALGVDHIIQRSMCQVPGTFYRLEARQFLDFIEQDAAFARAVRLYLHCLLGFTGRSAACNLLHGLTERCARWLLLTHDRTGKDTFTLTQDIMATMLGVHRPAVTIAAGALQKAGFIKYARGEITIVDREGLKDAACTCYEMVQQEFERVLGGPQRMGV
jgi:CRP-like cAMP-binding protein